MAVANKDTLREKGIVEKKGAVIGLGGAWRETGKIDPEVFKEIDYTEQAEVEIPAPLKKVRLLSEHPADSFELVAAGEKATTLKVTDPEQFWKADKTLVVMIPN